MVEVGDFLVLLLELFVGLLGQSVDVILEILPRFFDFEFELMLEGQQGIVGPLGLIGDVLLAAVNLSG